MEIKYELNEKDIWNYNRLQFIYRPQLRNNLAIYIIIVLYFTFNAFISKSNTGIAHIISLIIFFVFIYFLAKWILVKVNGIKSGALGEHVLRINSDGFNETTSVNQKEYNWSVISRIIQNRNYIFLYNDKMTAHIIPKRAFVDDGAAKHFYDFAVDLWRNNCATGQ